MAKDKLNNLIHMSDWTDNWKPEKTKTDLGLGLAKDVLSGGGKGEDVNVKKLQGLPDSKPTKTKRTEGGAGLAKDVLAKDGEKSDTLRKVQGLPDTKSSGGLGLAKTIVKEGKENKLENLLDFKSHSADWKPEGAKKTKRTDVALDVLKEGKEEE